VTSPANPSFFLFRARKEDEKRENGRIESLLRKRLGVQETDGES